MGKKSQIIESDNPLGMRVQKLEDGAVELTGLVRKLSKSVEELAGLVEEHLAVTGELAAAQRKLKRSQRIARRKG